MNRLLYISTARRPFSESELADVLSISRRNNVAVGITGLLVSGGRRFLQVLEGETAAVDATYERIRRDTRHFATVVLSNQSAEARMFAGWSMAYQKGAATDLGGGVRAEVTALVAPIADPTLRAYFEGFAAQQAA